MVAVVNLEFDEKLLLTRTVLALTKVTVFTSSNLTFIATPDVVGAYSVF